MSRQWINRIVAMAVLATTSAALATLNPISLNYNYNGIVHSSESGAPDDLDGYRSIGDRGLDFTAGVPSNATLDDYTLVATAGVLDIVHLGDRSGGFYAYDEVADEDDRGVLPNWLPDPDQTGPQTTTLANPIRIEATSYAGFVYQISEGGGDFDVRFQFSDGGADFVATLSGPDWYGPGNPTPIIGTFPGADHVDSGTTGAATLALTEGIVDLSSEVGRALVAITFENASNASAGYTIVAANVEGGDCGVLDCSGGACCLSGGGCSDVADEAACDALSGTYKGDATLCATADCATGACCTDGACTETISTACTSGGGVFVGSGTNCFSGVCNGACCDNGFCLDGLTEATCNGIYLGDASFCFDFTTPCNDTCEGAASVIDGSLFGDNSSAGPDDAEASCATSNHDIWYSYDASCEGIVTFDTEGSTDPNLDDTVLSVYDGCGGTEIACDNNSGTGLLASVSFESSQGTTYYIRVAGGGSDAGLFMLNIDCIDTGACCNSDLSCSDNVSEASCTGAGGTFNGIGSTCAESICSGACCAPDGVCSLTVDEAACQAISGYYHGDGVDCGEYTCQAGPCCLDGGETCTNLIEEACNEQEGTWFGPSGLTAVTGTSIAEVSSYRNPGVLLPDNIINGSGLSGTGFIGDQTHTNGGLGGGGSNTFWHSCEHGGVECTGGMEFGDPDLTPDDVFVTIDLGGSYDVESMLVWNFNVGLFGEFNRGIQQYDLLVAGDGIDPTDASLYTTIITDGLLEEAGGTDSEPAQLIPLNVTNIRYVRIEADSNYGGNVTGLSEVRFLYDAEDCSTFECPMTGACCVGGTCTQTTAESCSGYVCDQVALGGSGCLGDADLSGVVNASDRGFVSANIGISESDVGTLFATQEDFYNQLCTVDMDCSGVINASDRGFVSANIGVCTPLPPCQDGSGLNMAGDGPDERFPNAAGTFFGLGVSCDEVSCIGACCRSDGTCDPVPPEDCTGDSVFLGFDTECSTSQCPLFNDDCVDAFVAPDGATPFTTIGATLDGDAPAPGYFGMYDDVWYQYTASCIGNILIDTCDKSTPDDDNGDFSIIEAYRGCDCDNLEALGYSQFSGCGVFGGAAIVDVENTGAGQCYTIRVSGTFGSQIESLLTISCTDFPEAACCDNGSCSVTPEYLCNGTWLPDQDDCSGSPCTLGACCSDVGTTCNDTVESECADDWYTGESCSTFSCPNLGACCANDGTCSLTPLAACDGQWAGLGTDCSSLECSPLNHIELDYNWNGLVHAGEAGLPDDADGYRSIADRGLDFQSGVPADDTLDNYTIVDTAGTLDIVFAGDRVAHGPGFDSAADSDDVGIQPNWLPDPDLTGPQTTILPAGGLMLDGSSEAGVVFQITSGGGSFDMRFTFGTGDDLVVTLSGPDWYGPFNGQPNFGAFPGTGSTDTAASDATLLLTEAIVDLSAETGRRLTSISFENRSNSGAAYAFLAVNIRGSEVEGACCDGGSCSVTNESGCAGTWLPDVAACDAGTCDLGACCEDFGLTCLDGFEGECGGTWYTGESCSTFSCPTTGSCCLEDGSCTEETFAACTGIWGGVGTTCATADCSPINNITLNYNFNGLVHSGEAGVPDDPDGYRSISDRGLDFSAGVPADATLDEYDIVDAAGVLDIVHLGDRDQFGPPFDDTADGDGNGIQPNWLPDTDQTGPQTTALPGSGMLLDSLAKASVILQVSDGGGGCDMRFTFSSGPDVVVSISAPDWYGPGGGTPNIGAFSGTATADLAVSDATLLLSEVVVDLSSEAGRTLTSFSFENRSNSNAGYAFLAVNVRGTMVP